MKSCTDLKSHAVKHFFFPYVITKSYSVWIFAYLLHIHTAIGQKQQQQQQKSNYYENIGWGGKTGNYGKIAPFVINLYINVSIGHDVCNIRNEDIQNLTLQFGQVMTSAVSANRSNETSHFFF